MSKPACRIRIQPLKTISQIIKSNSFTNSLGVVDPETSCANAINNYNNKSNDDNDHRNNTKRQNSEHVLLSNARIDSTQNAANDNITAKQSSRLQAMTKAETNASHMTEITRNTAKGTNAYVMTVNINGNDNTNIKE